MLGVRECVCFQGPSPSRWNYYHVPNRATQAERITCAKALRRKKTWLMGGPDSRSQPE